MFLQLCLSEKFAEDYRGNVLVNTNQIEYVIDNSNCTCEIKFTDGTSLCVLIEYDEFISMLNS